MRARIRHTLGLLLTLGAACGFLPALSAQTPDLPGPRQSVDAAKFPPLPLLKSPVDMFRELLALDPAERERNLTNRPPEIRRRILAKLKEYEAMQPRERELRLRMTQLRWYLLTLLEIPPEGRAAQLTMVPEADRPLISDRLQQWDRLPVDEQKEILKYEKTMERILEGGSATNAAVAGSQSPARQDGLVNLDNFLKLPPARREQMLASFQKFFELGDEEKQRTMDVLSAAQRLQTSGVLQMFRNLPRAEREKYLNAVNKFSRMSDSERHEFMKNAERWRALSPAERQAWRSLVNQLPPLPPEVAFPPRPPHASLQVNVPSTTNAPQ